MRGVAKRLALPGALATALAMTACAVQAPQGPSYAAMPGSGKSYDQFRADDANCRQAAMQANGGVSAAEGASQSAVGSAALGTALGAAAGAAIGSATAHVGAGAAIGAGVGLLAGSAAGANSAQASSASLQRNYDITYAQCMAAAGESVPQVGSVPGGYAAYPYGYPPAYVYGPPVGVVVGGWGWHRHYWW